MMMTSSQFGLDDMEALLWGPSSPTADPLGSLLLHADQEEPRERGGASTSVGGLSPAPSFSTSLASSSPPPSSSSSPPPFYSPPPSPSAMFLQGVKAATELDLPWLAQPDQLGRSHTDADVNKVDGFCDLDWMTERVDLSEFDLESLIGSCCADDEPPSSPEDLLASLDCPMELDPLAALPTPPLSSLPPPTVYTTVLSTPPKDHTVFTPPVEPLSPVPSPPPCIPDPQEELEIKTEPYSPAPSTHSQPSPACTLELGSEVDVSECEEKPVVATVVIPRIVLSLSPTRIVLLLAPKDQVGVRTTTVSTTTEVIRPPPQAPTPAKTPRNRPYPEHEAQPGSPSPGASGVKVRSTRGVEARAGGRSSFKAPKEKKLKKMEQNKTAATRYRQKKRAEQESLGSEYAELERKNIELTEKADSMAREIQYLKELMTEVRMAKIKAGRGAADL